MDGVPIRDCAYHSVGSNRRIHKSTTITITQTLCTAHRAQMEKNILFDLLNRLRSMFARPGQSCVCFPIRYIHHFTYAVRRLSIVIYFLPVDFGLLKWKTKKMYKINKYGLMYAMQTTEKMRKRVRVDWCVRVCVCVFACLVWHVKTLSSCDRFSSHVPNNINTPSPIRRVSNANHSTSPVLRIYCVRVWEVVWNQFHISLPRSFIIASRTRKPKQ